MTSTSTTEPVTSTTRNDVTTVQTNEAENSEDRNSVAPSRVYQDVKGSVVALQGEIAGLEARSLSLTNALAASVEQAGAMPEVQARLAELQLQSTAAQNAYMNVRAAYEGAVLTNARVTEEVTLVDPATLPLYPDRPIRYVFAALGLVAGAIGSVGLAALVERRKRGRGSAAGSPGLGGSPNVPGPIPQPVLANGHSVSWADSPTGWGRASRRGPGSGSPTV
jgi:hypothetical protein